MDINQQKLSKKLNLQIGASLFLLIALIGGFTYAFFNFTRTGESNTLKLGNITFETTQNGNINLTNAFPISITRDNNGLITNVDDDNIDTVEILINGHTTYSDGVEYLVSSTDTVAIIEGGTKKVPISLDVQVGTNGSGTNNTLGTSDNDYFDNKDTYTTSHYKKLIGNTITGDEQILLGYIAPDTTGTDNSINGKITIKAYFDNSLVAITDTSDENEGWIQGRTVFTTSEWNSLRTNGVSFQVKVEAQEGIWVDEPAQGTIDSCPNCKFIYTTDSLWTTWNTKSQSPTVLTSGYSTNYNDIVTSSGKNYFLGVVTNASNQITNAYACGIYNGTTPFCIEGTADGANYSSNSSFINGSSLWNNTCTVESYYTECGFTWDGNSVSADADSLGYVGTGVSYGYRCLVGYDGGVYCGEGVGGE